MRERQQMASRPFASVDVVLEVGGDQEELVQVSKKTQTQIHTEIDTTKEHTHTVNTGEIMVPCRNLATVIEDSRIICITAPAHIIAALGRFDTETLYC